MDNETIVTLVKNNFPEAITGSEIFRNELTIIVKKEYITEIAGFMKENKELDFNFLSDLCGVDRVGTDGVFEVVYHLYSIYKNHRVRLKSPIASNDPCISTVTGIWNTANWHER
ncbi:MAG: NADH dehydrogenase, partial [Planctomycetes bacterium RIFCSPHIGHO2_12_42_15]